MSLENDNEANYGPYPVPAEPYATTTPLFDAAEPRADVREKPKKKKPAKKE